MFGTFKTLDLSGFHMRICTLEFLIKFLIFYVNSAMSACDFNMEILLL